MIDAERIPLLRFFPPGARDEIVALFREERYEFGQLVVREGDPADAYFVIVSGKARVLKSGEGGQEVPLDLLRPGDGFGEMGLLSGGTRAATVRASSELVLLRLDRTQFDRALEESSELREHLELQARHRELQNFLQHFSELKRVPLPALKAVLQELQPACFAASELVIREGDEAGPLYIVRNGRLRVFLGVDGRKRNVAFLRPGDFFGELSLLQRGRRTASVEALTDCELLALRPETLERLMQAHPELRALIEERTAQYNVETSARVPLDFVHEMLPAEVSAFDKVSETQLPTYQAPPSEDPGHPYASVEGYFKKRRGRIGRFPYVRQVDEMDCGAACLGMVCRFFGRKVSLARIRQLAHTALDGTSLLALCRAAEELGLAARTAKISLRNLPLVPVPAIVHWEGNHWIVLLEVRRHQVRVADPATGIRWIPRDQFEQKWSGYAALFDYTERFETAPEGQAAFSWVLPFLRPYRWVIAQTLLLALVVSGIQMLFPVFTQLVVDRVIVEQDRQLLDIIAISMGCTLGIMLLTSLIQRYMLSFSAVRIDAAILDYLMRRMLALPMSYFNSRRTGDIQRRLDGAREVRRFVVSTGIGGLLSLVQLVATLALMAVYSLQLLGVFLITAPLYALLMLYSARVLKPVFDDLEESYGRYRSHQIDAIKGIEAVKAASAEQVFRDLMLDEFLSVSHKQFRGSFIGMCYEAAIQAVGFLSSILFLYIGGLMVLEGKLSIGGFVAFNALVAMAFGPIRTVLGLWDDLQLSSVLMNRLQDIFEYVPEQGHDRAHLLPVRTLEGRVAFRDLCFRYGGPESPEILSKVDFEVTPGQLVAIVGRSGCGKTTLIKCLAGLLVPTEGTILFDDLEMKSLNHRDLRRHIGFVLQDNHMFSGTILHNIAFGDPAPDLDRVHWAASLANAHEFITRLPLGYETKIGETGLALSGGQKQRIAIARAIYPDPAILIFDEATSALDAESERAIQDNIDRLLRGRTVFVVAHRLSTVRDAELIVVLEQGRVAEHGTHETLMARRGLYFYLTSRQLEL